MYFCAMSDYFVFSPFRITKEHKAWLLKKHKEDGLNMSHFVRAAIGDAIKKAEEKESNVSPFINSLKK